MKSERVQIARFSTAFRRIMIYCFVCPLICLSGGAGSEAFAQKTRTKEKTPDSGRGKTGTRVKQEAPEPKEAQPLIKQVIVPPNEGYLALATTSEANIELKGLTRRAGKRFVYRANKQGLLSLEGLTPGSYQLDITREDFTPISETITINRGKQTPLVRFLVSQYGTIILSMGRQVAPDVAVRLNNQLIETARIKVEEGKLYVKRVPIGPREISLSKPGYEPWSEQRVILPGECDNLVTVTMVREAITLTVKSEPTAEVYVDKVRQGRILPDRTLVISDLLSGPHTLRIECEGFEPVELPLTLDLKRREVTQDVPLTLLVEDGEFSEDFSSTVKQWSVYWPSGWKPQTAPPLGILVKGDELSLAYNTSKPNRRFNFYSDFILTMSLKPINGKGVSWVVRAKDGHNYYLFELTTPLSSSGAKGINFYVFREGEIVRKESHPLLANIENLEIPIRLQMEAKGDRLSFRILGQGDRGNGPTIVDDTFRRGGIGLRAVNGIEMFVSEVLIQPLK